MTTYKCILPLLLLFTLALPVQSESGCLFKNPLCFYNADILTYLQKLYNQQQYDKMAVFFYGPAAEKLGRMKLSEKLSSSDFGYKFKRVGIIDKGKDKWSLTYQRHISATRKAMKIDCALVQDTCRIYLDASTMKLLFNQ